MEKANINGNDLEYSIEGSRNGEWVVFIHGSVFADMFVPLMSQPILSNFSKLHYHRRGYGGSIYNKSAPPSIGKQSSDILELMKFLNINSAHIVGHSYAGLIALQAAVDAPERVHSLSLMEPPLVAFVPSGEEFGSMIQTSIGFYLEGKKFESLDSFLRVVFEGSKDYRSFIDKQLGHDAFDNALNVLDTIYQLEFPALQTWKFDPEVTKSLSMPVLSVTGTDSPSFFQQVHSLLQSWLPHSETLLVPNTSHMLHMQNPELVAKGLESFFSRHPMNHNLH